MPTVLNFAGIKYNKKKLDGQSLMPIIKDDKNLDLVSFHLCGANRVNPEGSLAIVFPYEDSQFHFIKGRFTDQYQELFNITKDPEERINLIHDSKYSELITQSKHFLEDFEKKIRIEKRKREREKLGRKDREDVEALKSLGYIAGGKPAPEVASDKFLMQKIIPDLGQLKYHSIIRQPQWGIRNKDKYFPIKIVHAGNNLFYILANRERELLEYQSQKELISRKVSDILDMIYDPIQQKIYLLKKDGIYHFSKPDQKMNKELDEKVNSFLPIYSLHVDFSGNLYLFKEKKIVKLDQEKNIVNIFSLQHLNSSTFAVDKEQRKMKS
jgi:hypothetical protein